MAQLSSVSAKVTQPSLYQNISVKDIALLLFHFIPTSFTTITLVLKENCLIKRNLIFFNII